MQIAPTAATDPSLTTGVTDTAQSSTAALIEGSLDQAPAAGLAAEISMAPQMEAANDSTIPTAASGGVSELTPELARRTLDDASLALDAYNSSGAPEGYTRLSAEELSAAAGEAVIVDDPETGFGAGVYRNDETGDITVAFRGSQANSLQDIRTDWLETNFGQAFGRELPQSYEQGSNLARQINDAFGHEAHVSLTGHSMGGGIANFAAIENNLDFTAFNAAGLSAANIDRLGDNIDNYTGSGVVINDAYDPLTNYGGGYNAETWGTGAQHVGYEDLVFIDNPNFGNWWDTAFNFGLRVEAHNLSNVIPALEEASALA